MTHYIQADLSRHKLYCIVHKLSWRAFWYNFCSRPIIIVLWACLGRGLRFRVAAGCAKSLFGPLMMQRPMFELTSHTQYKFWHYTNRRSKRCLLHLELGAEPHCPERRYHMLTLSLILYYYDFAYYKWTSSHGQAINTTYITSSWFIWSLLLYGFLLTIAFSIH